MAMISFAVTAKLICTFVFAYADCWFSCAAAHIHIKNFLITVFAKFHYHMSRIMKKKNNRFLPMRKQRRRSAVQ